MSRAQVLGPILTLALSLLWAQVANSAQVKWRPNTSFDLPLNFQNGKLPCSKESVHFPETLITSVRISSVNSMDSLVLPIDGELDLSDGSAIYFGPKQASKETRKEETECVSGDVLYLEKSQMSWLQADAWDSEKFNGATPDAQRVPCYDDNVVFPRDAQFSVKLPNEIQYVSSISIGGMNVDRAQFKEIAETSYSQRQAFFLNDAQSVGVDIGAKPCQSRAGCPCQLNATTVDCSVKVCDAWKCKDPVLPTGNCCPICGGALKFRINVNIFDLMAFKRSVAKIVDEYGGTSKITYHLGLLSRDEIQVVMINKGRYDGTSAIAVQALDRSLGEDAYGMKQSLLSGAPLGKVGVAGEVVGFTLLFAVLVVAGIYVWYQRPEVAMAIPMPRIPTQTTGVFSRFHNRENSVTSLASRGFGTSFRNPLYSSNRGKAGGSGPAAPAAVSTADAAASGPPPAPVAGVDSVTRMSNLIEHLE